jgi:hypothetical protein
MADRAARISDPLDVVDSAARMLWIDGWAAGAVGVGIADGRAVVAEVLPDEAEEKEGSLEREDVDAKEAALDNDDVTNDLSLDTEAVECKRNSRGGTDERLELA